MPKFPIIHNKKLIVVEISAAEFTAMQEKGTAFILKRAFQDNIKFNSVDAIVKDKDTVAGLKKIFVKSGKSIFSYQSPVDIKSPSGSWLESFYQQQKKMLAVYSAPGWTVFNREGGFMDFITDLISEKFGIPKKDTWNPADIWLIKKKDVFRKKILEQLDGTSGTQTINKLNVIMRDMFKNNEVVGISLKKISLKEAQYTVNNLDSKFFKKLENRDGQYAYRFSSARLALGWDKNKKSFETADGVIKLKDNADKDNYTFQIKGNQTSSFSNLKFEPNALGGAAFLGKAPLDLVQKLVKDSKDVPDVLFNRSSRDNKNYPKSLTEFQEGVKIDGTSYGLKQYTEMFTRVKKAGVDTGNCKDEAQFKENMEKSFRGGDRNAVKAHSKLMILFFMDQLLLKKTNRDDLLTDIIFLAAKQGRKVSNFGVFGKLF